MFDSNPDELDRFLLLNKNDSDNPLQNISVKAVVQNDIGDDSNETFSGGCMFSKESSLMTMNLES